jgi:hypothetical protein
LFGNSQLHKVLWDIGTENRYIDLHWYIVECIELKTCMLLDWNKLFLQHTDSFRRQHRIQLNHQKRTIKQFRYHFNISQETTNFLSLKWKENYDTVLLLLQHHSHCELLVHAAHPWDVSVLQGHVDVVWLPGQVDCPTLRHLNQKLKSSLISNLICVVSFFKYPWIWVHLWDVNNQKKKTSRSLKSTVEWRCTKHIVVRFYCNQNTYHTWSSIENTYRHRTEDQNPQEDKLLSGFHHCWSLLQDTWVLH